MKSLATIDDLTPDSRNANKGTERGTGLVEKSLRNCGAGRSILVDKHGNVIAGNKTLEGWAQLADPQQILVVPTNGTQLVVVQRVDLDLDQDKRARELAILDNRVGETNLDWDGLVVAQLAQDYGISPGDVGFSDAEFSDLYAGAAGIDEEEKPANEITCPHCGATFEKPGNKV